MLNKSKIFAILIQSKIFFEQSYPYPEDLSKYLIQSGLYPKKTLITRFTAVINAVWTSMSDAVEFFSKSSPIRIRFWSAESGRITIRKSDNVQHCSRTQSIDTLSWFNVVFPCRDHGSGPHTVTLSLFQMPVKWFKFFRFKSNQKPSYAKYNANTKTKYCWIQISVTVISLRPCGVVITPHITWNS